MPLTFCADELIVLEAPGVVGRFNTDNLENCGGRPARQALVYIVPAEVLTDGQYSFGGDQESFSLATMPLIFGDVLVVDGYQNLRNFRFTFLTGTGTQNVFVAYSS